MLDNSSLMSSSRYPLFLTSCQKIIHSSKEMELFPSSSTSLKRASALTFGKRFQNFCASSLVMILLPSASIFRKKSAISFFVSSDSGTFFFLEPPHPIVEYALRRNSGLRRVAREGGIMDGRDVSR